MLLNEPSFLNTVHPWCAAIVRPNLEKAVAATLGRKGFTTYLPLCRERRKWSDRVKTVESPLFPSYVFCRMDPACGREILKTPGIISFVDFGEGPATIPEQEIDLVKRLLNADGRIALWPGLKEGDPVRVICGPLRDIEGTLIQVEKELRVVVGLKMLNRSLAVTVDSGSVAPLRSAPLREVRPCQSSNLGRG